jgi:hypothetical protein
MAAKTTLVYATSGYGEMPATAYAYRLEDLAGGGAACKMTPTATPPPGTNYGTMAMWLTASPDGRHAYTVDMGGDGSVYAHAIGAGGALTTINNQPSLGAGPCVYCSSLVARTLACRSPRRSLAMYIGLRLAHSHSSDAI